MKALLLVDIQNDFLPGGALAIQEGDKILPIVNALMQHPFDLIVATKDWHPSDHISFAITHGKKVGEVEGGQILWPVHCVMGTYGAEFSDELDTEKIQQVFHKGVKSTVESYSSFFDAAKERSTGLEEYLLRHHIDTVYIAGLATDYCVKYSTLDALQLGFKVYVVKDGCVGIDLHKGDVDEALKEMERSGAHVILSKDV